MRVKFLAAALAASTTTACTAQFVVDPESTAPYQVIATGRINNGLNELKEALKLPATQDKFYMAFTLLLFQLKLGRKEIICVPSGWDASTLPNNAADGWLGA